jgi:hypothetical protein
MVRSGLRPRNGLTGSYAGTNRSTTRARSRLVGSLARSVLGNPHGAMHFPTHLILDLWRYADLALRLRGTNLVTLLEGRFWITSCLPTNHPLDGLRAVYLS